MRVCYFLGKGRKSRLQRDVIHVTFVLQHSFEKKTEMHHIQSKFLFVNLADK